MDAALLRKILRYDPETGVFTWLIDASSKAPAGSVAGTNDSAGYRIIRFSGVGYKAHRLAWLYVHGTWPVGILDHRNERKDDNRIDNLRDTDVVVNTHNNSHPNHNSQSGLRGVSWFSQYQKWKATIQVRGRKIFLGHFDDKHEAHRAYLDARKANLPAEVA